MSRRALLRATLGIAISVVAAFILIRSVDIEAAFQVMRTANPAWIGVMFVTVLIDVGARGARWRSLLAPIKAIPYRRVLGFTYVGYLANNVLPARLGELVRSHALGEGEDLSRTTVLGTVVVERIVDTLIVVGLAALSVVVLSVRGVLSSAVLLGFAFVALLVLGLALAMALHRLPGADRVVRFAEQWPRVLELARRLREGLAVAGKPRVLAAAILWSAVAWSASIGTTIAASQSIGVELSLGQAALITSGVALVTIIPAGPGYVGTFELTAVSIAATFGIPRDEAFAFALLAHLMILAVTTVGGVIATVRLHVGFGMSTGSAAEDDAEAGDAAEAVDAGASGSAP